MSVSRNELLADGLLTVREAAEWLRVSQSTLYELMGHGGLAWTKIGGQRRIPKRALVEFAMREMRQPEVVGN